MKKAGMQMRPLLMSSIVLLWLLCLGVMLVWEAREIRDRMEACVQSGFETADQRVEAVSQQDSPDKSDYLLSMEGQEKHGLSGVSCHQRHRAAGPAGKPAV